MENLSELKQHLRATRQTRQIANAMYLLSASQVKRSLQNMEYNLSYMQKLHEVMADILFRTPEGLHKVPFFKLYEHQNPLYVVITSDKGLCGGYHAAVVNLAITEMQKAQDPQLVTVGDKGAEMLANKGFVPDIALDGFDQQKPFVTARFLTEKIIQKYQTIAVNEAYMVYTEYVNAAVQKPVCKRVLPFLQCDFEDQNACEQNGIELIYEPDAQTVLNHLAPQYLTGMLADIMIQATACENTARMAAMQNATRNADEMANQLNDKINAIRQLMITNEITEIAAAAEMNGAV